MTPTTEPGRFERPHTARLADGLRRLRSDRPVPNALLELAGKGDLRVEHLRRLVCVEMQCHIAEMSAYATLVARFPHRPTAGLFLDAGRMVYDAHPKLRGCAAALGVAETDFYRWPSGPVSHAFSGLVSRIALHGDQAAAASALHADLTTYFPDTFELLERLERLDLEVPQEFVSYYEGDQPEEMIADTLDVIEHGLDHGDDPETALATARLTHEHLALFWDAAAGAD